MGLGLKMGQFADIKMLQAYGIGYTNQKIVFPKSGDYYVCADFFNNIDQNPKYLSILVQNSTVAAHSTVAGEAAYYFPKIQLKGMIAGQTLYYNCNLSLPNNCFHLIAAYCN